MRMERKWMAACLLLLGFALTATAQEHDDEPWLMAQKRNDVQIGSLDGEKEDKVHLLGALTLGTTGVGVDLAVPLGPYVQVRAGGHVMPSLKKNMHFGLRVGDKAERKYDKDGNRIETKFDRMAKMFNELTGYEIGEKVDMIGRPTFWGGKVLVDVFPFQNKKWFFTAGVYCGPSQVAKAYNGTEEVKTLFSVAMYNHIYGKVEEAYADPYNPFNEVTLYELKGGGNVILPQELTERMHANGRMGIHLGDYFLEPDADCMVRAKVKTNAVRPYLGFGYGNAAPAHGRRYGVALEAGVMMWGGTPLVDCYGTDLVYQNVKGTAGRYIDVIKTLKVYPVVNLRISRRLF